MQTVATRSELLARRSRAGFAAQGKDLLTDKRAALVREFTTRTRDMLDRAAELRRLAVTARTELAEATAERGPAEVASASFAAGAGVEVRLTVRIVAGVPVTDLRAAPVRRPPDARGYDQSLVPARVTTVADAYERYVERLLDVCADELTVRRLAAEISRTTRQVNALEHVVIPRLRAEAARIQLVLDEREREDRARLGRARERRNARGALERKDV